MTYYDILQVSENASEEVIRMAYKALAKKYHPDVFEGDPKIAEQKMKEINEAYEVLSNNQKRAEYDASLHNNESSHHTENNKHVVPHFHLKHVHSCSAVATVIASAFHSGSKLLCPSE